MTDDCEQLKTTSDSRGETRAASAESARQAALLRDRVAEWRSTLMDTGRSNRMLYYDHPKSNSLEITDADRDVIAALLRGQRVHASQLLTNDADLDDAQRRLRRLHKDVQVWAEERGIDAGYAAVGFASWKASGADSGGRPPSAPVLLFPLAVRPRSAAATEFVVEVTGQAVVNPVLRTALEREYGVVLDEDILLQRHDETSAAGRHALFDEVTRKADAAPEFVVEPRVVLGRFDYSKLPMATDLERAGELLVANDVVAALAGDEHAQSRLLALRADRVDLDFPDAIPPRYEYLVCDADSSQSWAVNTVLAGGHAVIKGPPGTGKSQTIANLISALAARGKSVLFVAEKRAAIEAVGGRLAQVGLGDLMIDLHGGSDRRRIAEELGARLHRLSAEREPAVNDLMQRLEHHRAQLVGHADAVHAPREPWGVSAFQVQEQLIDLRDDAVTARLSATVLERVHQRGRSALRERVREYAHLQATAPAVGSDLWAQTPLTDDAEAERVHEQVGRLAYEHLPQLQEQGTRVARECGLHTPESLADWGVLRTLLDEVRGTMEQSDSELYTRDLEALHAATADGRWRRRHGITMGLRERRRHRTDLRKLSRGPAPERRAMHDLVTRAADQRTRWHARRADTGEPRPPADQDSFRRACAVVEEALAELQPALPELSPESAFPALRAQLESLAADRAGLQRQVRRNQLAEELRETGLAPFLRELGERYVTGEQAPRCFDYLYYASVLDRIAATEPRYGQFDGARLHDMVAGYQQDDREHVQLAAARVRRAAAERMVKVLDAHEEQAQLVRREANRKRRHMPLRELFAHASQTMLAIKPCWSMSPLTVSQLLPRQQLFDVVVFDEASQVRPVEGIPSIMRGAQIVVAGDEHQLPPTAFFGSSGDEQEDTSSLTSDMESLLDSLDTALPRGQVRHLKWHYRSRDERLIAFSNEYIYKPTGNTLVTFPGMRSEGTVTHVRVDAVPTANDRNSPSAEVEQVVQLVLDHAAHRPRESLGVITMGNHHADRVEAALQRALADRPDLEGFFAEGRAERFFVKSIERVQGDERDAVILSVGYGKGPDGRLSHNFGPLNQQGGHRRLNVAVTRAKQRMTVVSSFGSRDMDPNKLHADGARLLRSYLAFAEAGGELPAGDGGRREPKLNVFEADVRDRLSEAGVPVVCQYGVSGYYIDFAAQHPQRPGEMVLAIEADGASYHSTPTARDRDRLRQQHLENLGWRFCRIWSTDWFRDHDAEVRRVRAAYDAAVAAADEAPSVGTESASAGCVNAPVDGAAGSGALGDTASERMVAPGKLEESTEDVASPPPRSPWPAHVERGLKIQDYDDQALADVVRWVLSDGALRTTDDVLAETMRALGFKRRGSRIEQRLTAAIERARGS